MAIVGSYKQQPSDVLDYAFDYSDFLQVDDSLLSATSSVTPSGLTVNAPFVSDKQIKFWVSGGTDGVKYKLTITATTAVGRVKQDEAYITIKEI